MLLIYHFYHVHHVRYLKKLAEHTGSASHMHHTWVAELRIGENWSKHSEMTHRCSSGHVAWPPICASEIYVANVCDSIDLVLSMCDILLTHSLNKVWSACGYICHLIQFLAGLIAEYESIALLCVIFTAFCCELTLSGYSGKMRMLRQSLVSMLHKSWSSYQGFKMEQGRVVLRLQKLDSELLMHVMYKLVLQPFRSACIVASQASDMGPG